MKASDCKCCECGQQAEVFYPPYIYPDIPSHPYCNKCLDEAKTKMIVEILNFLDKK